MANELIRVKNGNQLLFADHATDFGASPATAANSLLVGTQTDIQMDLTGLAASGGARESAKSASIWGGTGSDEAPLIYKVGAVLEFASAPTDNDGTVDFYAYGSPSSTAGTGNPGGLTGADAAVTDTPGKLSQLRYIGSMSVRANVINISECVGWFQPYEEYLGLLIVNNVGTALRSAATAMDETHVVFTPYTLRPTA